MKFYQVVCNVDKRREIGFQLSTPTTCPVNAAHAIGAVTEIGDLRRLRTITNNNSPFCINRQDGLICDTSSGNITIELPSALEGDVRREFLLIKSHASNTVTVNTFSSETIDGQGTATLTAVNEYLAIVSDGSDWQLLDRGGTRRLAERFIGGTDDFRDNWVFHRTTLSGRNGGSPTLITWTDLTLNTIVQDSGAGVSQSGADFTLDPGTYSIRATSVFFNTGDTRLRWRNKTDSTTDVVSISIFARKAEMSSTIQLLLQGTIFIRASKTYALQYYCATEDGNTSLGRATGSGEDEVYTTLYIEKI
jgi:hypothetical protein